MTERFFNPHVGQLTFEQVVSIIVESMAQDAKARYEILVGTDSSSGSEQVDFFSAVVLHKVGKGGRYFLTRRKESSIPSLRQKIWREAWLSF